MSVATKNPFALLDADDASPSPSPAPPAQTTAQPTPPSTTSSQKPRGPASRGGKYYPRGGRPPRDPNQPQAEEPVTENARKTEGRGEGRGRGRGRGNSRGGRRPFDRHSQTGKIDTDKRVHQGWGGDEGNTELKAEEAAANDAAAEATPDTPALEGAEPTNTEDKAEGGRPRREREPEEEDTTLTLDQYLAQRKEKETNLPKIEETRQANEGASDIWQDAVVLAKPEEGEAYFVGKVKNAPKSRTKKEEKVYIEIDGRFERPDRGGRGRGRGGDRARASRGRGGNRGGRQNSNGTPALNVDDQTAFPSLA